MPSGKATLSSVKSVVGLLIDLNNFYLLFKIDIQSFHIGLIDVWIEWIFISNSVTNDVDYLEICSCQAKVTIQEMK